MHAPREICKFCLSHIVSNVTVLFVVSCSQSISFFPWIIPTYYKNCFVFFVVRSLRYPIWSNFQMVRVARISLKHITPDVILHNLIRFPTTCLVSRWPLSDVEKSRPRKHWPWKRSLCITRKALRFSVLLLSEQFSLCFSFFVFFQWFMWAIGWANVADSDLISGVLVFATTGNPKNNTTFPVCIYICQPNCLYLIFR